MKKFGSSLFACIIMTILLFCSDGFSITSKAAESNDLVTQGKAILFTADANASSVAAAKSLFEQAASQGDMNAYYYLGILADYYQLPIRDYATANYYYTLAGETNPAAYVALAMNYHYGAGIEQNDELATAYCQKAIDAGYGEGYFGLASMAYDNGNLDNAVSYMEKGESSCKDIFFKGLIYENLSVFYYRGFGKFSVDYDKATHYANEAILLGNSDAMTEMGYYYMNGKCGITQNGIQAITFFGHAAALGNALGIYYRGKCYYSGIGTTQNYATALDCFKQAAAVECTDAMNAIGYMYVYGIGVKKDWKVARSWYEKSLALGDTSAAQSIAVIDAGGGVVSVQ